ncbi:hypothetical protein PHLGIDRAFT_409598 [Phlebiopsis gigantea 11061_1 CR5-6]|uniref:Uncharacterized protein n=1 Tax=Phlebiopsis gigantea (strain 11061_1 CR5-6) TaxID=745531 RepID=A0A0C3PM45_PHLG1|nr:hypothetical protein PHLGIDRAFT_409598 [Phlebiopsis gigantea 11061_1 CR5-6]
MSTRIDIRLSIFHKSFFSNALLAAVSLNPTSVSSSQSQSVLPIMQGRRWSSRRKLSCVRVRYFVLSAPAG